MILMSLAFAVVWSGDVRSAPAPKGGLVLPDGRVFVAGSRSTSGVRELVLHGSGDAGKSWKEVGVVTTDPSPQADLGDGNLVRLRDGRLLCVFRRNHHGSTPDYAIEVAESRDGGRTWKKHSTVEAVRPEGPGPSRGLWAPFLFVTRKGDIQCYYDDEHLPWKSGVSGHQWIVMKTWRGGQWASPTVVARESEGLSRDGMATVAETSPGRLLCVVEAVRAERPHAGVLRGFASSDVGRTWGAPSTVYAPKEPFHAFAPSVIRVGKSLVLAFATNEDRSETLPTGNPPDKLRLDIKSIVSEDGGRTWSAPSLVFGSTHRSYLPSLVSLGRDRLLTTFHDFERGPLAVEGRLSRR
ncbi:exo-alpha-sialidase [bacterium]|nr:MAG: exo-alpha-sialidase [bacterium]